MSTNHFGKTLRQLMEQRGYSATYIAEKTGIAKSSISNYLNGAQEPRLNGQLLKLARLLGVTLEYLVTGSQEPEESLIKEMTGDDSNNCRYAEVHRGVYRVKIERYVGPGDEE